MRLRPARCCAISCASSASSSHRTSPRPSTSRSSPTRAGFNTRTRRPRPCAWPPSWWRPERMSTACSRAYTSRCNSRSSSCSRAHSSGPRSSKVAASSSPISCGPTSPKSALRSLTRKGSSTSCVQSRGPTWLFSSASLRARTARPDVSACERASTSSTFPQSPASRTEAGIVRPPVSPARRRSRRSRTSCAGSSLPPRALNPAGIVLVDKPGGPSSFAIVSDLRRRTGARTGHAGTLDPFATGLLLLLSGSATKVASCFVGLDKRYVTDVDLTARTSTGDPEGDVSERLEPPTRAELERRLAGLRGDIELPIPAASAVKIGGERAYKLARRGIEVQMPVRRSRVDALDVISYTGDEVRLDLRVSSGTYVRAIADALGGHCRTLRRLEIGPFSVDEADPGRFIPVDEALARL